MSIDTKHLLKIQREFEEQKKKHPEMRERHCPVSLFGKILGEAFEAHRLQESASEAYAKGRREAFEEAVEAADDFRNHNESQRIAMDKTISYLRGMAKFEAKEAGK